LLDDGRIRFRIRTSERIREAHSLPEVVQLGGGHRVDHELDLLFPVPPGVGLSLLALALQGALNLRQLRQGSLQALPRFPTETELERVNKPVKAVIFTACLNYI
jgi:hypothetical protein